MNAYDLKSLLYDYLAILRSPGGAEKIGFAIEQHIKKLDLYMGGQFVPVSLRDLPRYNESAPRGEHRETEGCAGCSSTPLSGPWDDRRD